jgi:phospholipid-binding lipoprotein MlaA
VGLALSAGALTLAASTAFAETTTTTIGSPTTATNTTGGPHSQNNDPLESVNRYFFALDMDLDDAILRPTAIGYRWLVPRPARKGIRNALDNLDSPVIFANDVLQGELSRAATTTARFGINSTIGVLGLFDVAKAMGLPRHEEDFGQTLAIDGDIGGGPYLVLPILGPTNVRDLTGRVVDIAFDPLTWMGGSNAQTFAISRFVLDAISEREENIETFDEIERSSIDLYSQVRSIYNQHRNAEIKNGKDDSKDLPDLGGLEGN